MFPYIFGGGIYSIENTAELKTPKIQSEDE
jgi:hypothetical protein